MIFVAQFYQGVIKCGSTGAALRGDGRPNRGNDADWGKKKKKEEIRKRKRAKGKEKREEKKKGKGKMEQKE